MLSSVHTRTTTPGAADANQLMTTRTVTAPEAPLLGKHTGDARTTMMATQPIARLKSAHSWRFDSGACAHGAWGTKHNAGAWTR